MKISDFIIPSRQFLTDMYLEYIQTSEYNERAKEYYPENERKRIEEAFYTKYALEGNEKYLDIESDLGEVLMYHLEAEFLIGFQYAARLFFELFADNK